MKLNIAFHLLLAVICTASHARARAPSNLRDPRTVEEKEQVQRQTMGDYVSSTMLDNVADGMKCRERLAAKEIEYKNQFDVSDEEVKSLACTDVSTEFGQCHGCQGYSQVGREVHIPGCVGMTPDQCMDLAKAIVDEKPDWFKDGKTAILVSEMVNFVPAGEMSYYKLALPVSADSEVDPDDDSRYITGVAGDCMVHYPWDWCVLSLSNRETVCLKLQPWDCSAAVGVGCLSAYKCCAQIQDDGYPKPDINGNELQCYEWELPVKSSGGGDSSGPSDGSSEGASGTSGSGGVTGNRLVIHVSEGKVALPAVIADDNHEVTHSEEIIVPINKCFPNEYVPKTLKAAVADYVDQKCATTNPDCEIGKEWGYPINSWCVEEVTSFSELFRGLTSFNEDVNGWTTSQVTRMNWLFFDAAAFNQPLDNWDVSSVIHSEGMFQNAAAFNQPLKNWDVSSFLTMSRMFNGAMAFNQPLDNWKNIGGTQTAGNIAFMFSNAKAFNQPLNNWDVSRVRAMAHVFFGASAFDQPLYRWNTSSATSMEGMFRQASAFNQPLNSWDASKVVRMADMFHDAKSFNQNLCRFGASSYTGGVSTYYGNDMFDGTRCTSTTTPTSAKGPWCKYC